MVEDLFGVFRHALLITGFVFVMMLVIEYLNVLTQGAWQRKLARHTWGQYVLASLLGATPGCLGAFAVVAMYTHGVLTVGAIVAAMVATSGDESFVMLAMMPKPALLLFGVLFALGIAAGALTDLVAGRKRWRVEPAAHPLEVHDEAACRCFPHATIVRQWRECSAPRGILTVVLVLFVLTLVLGWAGPATWNWMRVTAVLVSGVALFIVCTVPDHFLNEHLWEHVARKHAPRIFLWTFGALAILYFITEHLHLEQTIQQGRWIVLAMACLVGLIPESGPHLVVVTLYAEGSIPLSILLASSVVQDGHGMLPLLAHSRRDFLVIKAINLAIGLAVGAAALAVGL
ncbi:MAG: putative manganese transporter [Phycisphaerae bacterium]